MKLLTRKCRVKDFDGLGLQVVRVQMLSSCNEETFMVWRYQNLFNIQNNRLLEDRIFIFFSLRYYWLKNLFDKLDHTRTKKLGVEILTNTNSFFLFYWKVQNMTWTTFKRDLAFITPHELDFLEHFLRRNIMYNRLMA